jgi:hypothetical protein
VGKGAWSRPRGTIGPVWGRHIGPRKSNVSTQLLLSNSGDAPRGPALPGAVWVVRARNPSWISPPIPPTRFILKVGAVRHTFTVLHRFASFAPAPGAPRPLRPQFRVLLRRPPDAHSGSMRNQWEGWKILLDARGAMPEGRSVAARERGGLLRQGPPLRRRGVAVGPPLPRDCRSGTGREMASLPRRCRARLPFTPELVVCSRSRRSAGRPNPLDKNRKPATS